MVNTTQKMLNDTKQQVKELEKQVNAADRLIWLLKDFGQPVQDKEIELDQLKNQLTRMKVGIEKDKQYYNADNTVKE